MSLMKWGEAASKPWQNPLIKKKRADFRCCLGAENLSMQKQPWEQTKCDYLVHKCLSALPKTKQQSNCQLLSNLNMDPLLAILLQSQPAQESGRREGEFNNTKQYTILSAMYVSHARKSIKLQIDIKIFF